MTLKVLVCEPYFTGSHRAWAEGLAAHSAHDVRLVTHPGRFWKWRMHGAALTLAEEIDRLAETWMPDVLLVSDMVHVPALLGLARRALTGVPVAVYFHENQMTYPLPDDESPDHTYAVVNWLSAAAADRLVFNSEHHRRDVAAALPGLLRQFPDQRHGQFVDEVLQRSSVLPVGIDADRFTGPGPDNDPPVVLWNHRWDYDKDPATFFRALATVADAGVDFELIIAGESYGMMPSELREGRERFSEQVVFFGTADDEQYPELLRQADVVISTALHEFFGVAVVEAITAGALPLLPNRLSYPELVPSPDYLYETESDLVDRLVQALTDHDGRRAAVEPARRHVERFAWPRVAPLYDRLFEELVRSAPGSES